MRFKLFKFKILARNKNMKKIILPLAFCCLTFFCMAQPYSQQMANTAINLWKDSSLTKWSYEQGVVLKGIENVWYATGNGKYFKYMQNQIDCFVQKNGDIKTYEQSNFNLDDINNGKILLTLFNVTGDAKYWKAATQLREQLSAQPRNKQGGFWHKKIYPNQMWLDGLYMAEPFYAEYASLSHDDTAFNDIAHQFILIEKNTRNNKTGLLYHAWDESKQQQWANKITGCSPHSWARAMGWYGAALVDVLDFFPQNNAARKELINILNRWTNAIAKTQNKQTGLWLNVLDATNEKQNYEEASAASLFVYTVAKAVRNGYISSSKIQIAKKAYNGILKNFIKQKNNQINFYGTVKTSGLGGNPYRDGSLAYYMSEPVVMNDAKCIGAFILASNEMELMKTLNAGKGKTILLDHFFNSEMKKDITGKLMPFHYVWEEKDNNGFSLLGNVFNKYGIKTQTLYNAPTAQNLKNADIYLIVDADNIADNPEPNYMQPQYAQTIYNWVKNGGILVLLHNDKGNAEFEHFNQLPEKFGIHYNEDSYNRQENNKGYEFGAIYINNDNEILFGINKIYQKEISSINVKSPAVSALQKDGINIFAIAKIGKGTVFATGDPWLYNEYIDGRKLPLEYENFNAANKLVEWLIKQFPTSTK